MSKCRADEIVDEVREEYKIRYGTLAPKFFAQYGVVEVRARLDEMNMAFLNKRDKYKTGTVKYILLAIIVVLFFLLLKG